MFLNVPTGTANGGLIDIFATLAFSPITKLKLKVDYHFFNLQNNVLDNSVNEIKYLDKHLGDEVDFGFNWMIIREISLSGGYCFMLPTNSLEIIQGISPGSSQFSSFGWLMLIVKPTIFTSKE